MPSTPCTGDNVPEFVAEFRERVLHWEQAVCGWLGLPLDRVISGSVHSFDYDGKPITAASRNPDMPTFLTYESYDANLPEPKRGIWGGWTLEQHAYAGDDDNPHLTGKVALDWRDVQDFQANVGAEPQLFTPAEELRLRHMTLLPRINEQVTTVAMNVRTPLLCEPPPTDDNPTVDARNKVTSEIQKAATSLLDDAIATGDRRGVLITYTSTPDAVQAEVRLSDQVPAGEIQRAGEEWRS